MAPDSVRLLRITLKAIVAPELLGTADSHWNPLLAGTITICQRTLFPGVALSPPEAITRCRSSLAPRGYRLFPEERCKGTTGRNPQVY